MTDRHDDGQLSEDDALRLAESPEYESRLRGAVWLAVHCAEGQAERLVALMVDDPDTAVSAAIAWALLERGDDLGVELFIRAHVGSAATYLGAADDLYETWWSYLNRTDRPLEQVIAPVRTAWNAAETTEDRTALMELLTAAGAAE